jgi:hypothetical protein
VQRDPHGRGRLHPLAIDFDHAPPRVDLDALLLHDDPIDPNPTLSDEIFTAPA